MGGAYQPYVPDMLAGFEFMMEPLCEAPVAQAGEALRALQDAGSLICAESG